MHMANSKRDLWNRLDIDQCITLFLGDMGKNYNLVIAAPYF
jgi:hypothetical protein